MKPEVKCPAAEEANPAFSRNSMDVRCRIQGNLRPAREAAPPTRLAGEPVVCCADYATCIVWKTAKQIEEGQSTGEQRRALVSEPHSGVMQNATRDRIAVS